ncbi:ParB/RepB/Spo0J family partition protein [Candidatus Parcubacteria bacterium]|nr:ParB/RepB/Spo0J family partition protein [Candidatus Parcubacteria bacterium]
MNKKTSKGLGKGFGSLLPDDFDRSMLLDKKDRIQKVLLSEVSPDKNQPRKHFDQTSLKELAISIKNHGILQPLVVRPEDGQYVIIAGERRFRAAKIAGLNSLPVLVRSSAEQERLEIGLVENVQRVDLSPLEQAISIAKLNQQFNLSYEEIGKKLGKAQTTVVNMVRLLKLPPDAREALQNDKISEGHARTILSLSASPGQQKKLLDSIIKYGWSVRRAEQYANEHKKTSPAKKLGSNNLEHYRARTEAISKKLEAKVVIKPKSEGGDLKITYKNDKDLERIFKLLAES